MLLLPLRHLPHRPVCEHPLTLPTPFSRYTKGSLEAVQRVGTNCLPAHSGEKRAPETATKASETPPPTTMSDPHRPCSPAFPGNTTLYTKGWALGRGASLQMPLNPCSSRSDPGVQERARQKLTERRDQGPLPEARAEGKGAQRATSSSRWWPSVCAWSPHARVCPQLGLPKL